MSSNSTIYPDHYTMDDFDPTFLPSAAPFLPCNTSSTIHDLICGHRCTIPTTPSGPYCAANCQFQQSNVSYNTTFICHLCTAEAVLSGLNIPLADDADALTLLSDSQIATSLIDVAVEEEYAPYRASGSRFVNTESLVKMDGWKEFVGRYGPKVLKVSEQEMSDLETAMQGVSLVLGREEEKAEGQKMKELVDVFGQMEIDG